MGEELNKLKQKFKILSQLGNKIRQPKNMKEVYEKYDHQKEVAKFKREHPELIKHNAHAQDNLFAKLMFDLLELLQNFFHTHFAAIYMVFLNCFLHHMMNFQMMMPSMGSYFPYT